MEFLRQAKSFMYFGISFGSVLLFCYLLLLTNLPAIAILVLGLVASWLSGHIHGRLTKNYFED